MILDLLPYGSLLVHVVKVFDTIGLRGDGVFLEFGQGIKVLGVVVSNVAQNAVLQYNQLAESTRSTGRVSCLIHGIVAPVLILSRAKIGVVLDLGLQERVGGQPAIFSDLPRVQHFTHGPRSAVEG